MTKNCTDIEQSKKLVELGTDVNTADMFWVIIKSPKDNEAKYACHIISTWTNGKYEDLLKRQSTSLSFVPAWSLNALLDLMPYEITIKDDNNPYRLSVTHKLVHYPRLTTMWPSIYSVEANTTLDAAFEVICELLEDKII